MKSFAIDCLGYSVAADWYEGTGDEILLVLIGYTSDKKNYEELLTSLTEQTDTSILVFDYSGHGVSPFDLRDVSPAQNFLEVIKVFDQLKAKHPDKKINVMGTSYGGYLAVQLTKYREFDKLVLRVPAILRPEAFYTTWGVRLDDEKAYMEKAKLYNHDTKELKNHPLLARAGKFRGKTLVVVHENDELVPKEVTDTYIEVFDADTYLAKGFPHSFHGEAPASDKEAYKTAIANWLKN